MQVNIERTANALIINPVGRLDGLNAKEFEERLRTETGESDGDVVMDFSRLNYVSSAGLRAILLIAKLLNGQKRSFKLCSMPENILEVFKISGFNQIMDIYDTREQAGV